MITVKLFAQLREAAGVKEIQLEARSVAEAREKLLARFGNQLQGGLARAAALVNGENVRFLAGEQTPLEAGDILSFLPPVAGG